VRLVVPDLQLKEIMPKFRIYLILTLLTIC
jgi:hypothetical protein